MFQTIKNLIKNHQLKKSEREWRLYNSKVESQINWEFSFIDQYKTGGHFNSQIILDNEKQVCNSVIVINLNKRVTEEAIIHSLNHEAIHASICECMLMNKEPDFVETVINDWMMGASLESNGWSGNIYVKKRPQK